MGPLCQFLEHYWVTGEIASRIADGFGMFSNETSPSTTSAEYVRHLLSAYITEE